MKKTIALVAMGLLTGISSLALADTQPVAQPVSKGAAFEFHCRLDGCDRDGKPGSDELECWVEGSICLEYDSVGAFSKRCNGRDDDIRIRCNNGFLLSDRNPAVQTNRDDLWINAEGRRGLEKDGEDHGNRESLATLNVELFGQPGKSLNPERRLQASLLFSESPDGARRVKGECRFERKEDL